MCDAALVFSVYGGLNRSFDRRAPGPNGSEGVFLDAGAALSEPISSSGSSGSSGQPQPPSAGGGGANAKAAAAAAAGVGNAVDNG